VFFVIACVDLLQEDGLARARRRHDHASLALADRGDEIHDARLDLIGHRSRG
jgi:hypothetical protein